MTDVACMAASAKSALRRRGIGKGREGSTVDLPREGIGRGPGPGPVVDGDGGEGGLEAVGQGSGRAEPLPRAAEGEEELEGGERADDQELTWCKCGGVGAWETDFAVTYSSAGGTTGSAVDTLCESPGVPVQQGGGDGLGQLGRGDEQVGLSWDGQAGGEGSFCRGVINTRKYRRMQRRPQLASPLLRAR